MLNLTWIKNPDHVSYCKENEVLPRLARELGIADLARKVYQCWRECTPNRARGVQGFHGLFPVGLLLCVDERNELLQRQLHVAAQAAGGVHGFRELGAVHVNMDDLRKLRKLLAVARHAALKRTPSEMMRSASCIAMEEA